MLEAVQTSEKSLNSYILTRRYNPEDSHLHSHRGGHLKSYHYSNCFEKYVHLFYQFSASGFPTDKSSS
jgi:hypothetical protein